MSIKVNKVERGFPAFGLWFVTLTLGLLSPGLLLAASLSQGGLLTGVVHQASGNTLRSGSSVYAFTQASDAAEPGFTVMDSSGEVIFYASDDSTVSATTVQSLIFDGDPIALGVPGELGSLTIGAGNSIADVVTDRTYTRPVVFTQLVSNSSSAGAAIVPTMPLMEGNTFTFAVETASGLSPDLEGATLQYFIAEEGWHRLVDGRLLLISSVELRDEDYAGLSFELGAAFTGAVTIAQLQRPALILNSDGSVTQKSGYQGVMLSGGQGDFNSLTMRFMADASYEAEATVRNFGARIGFMVLGNATVRDDWPLVYRKYHSPSTVVTVAGEDAFTNFRHSAAASPLFNKVACADDADLDGYCFYMSPPVDMPSRQSRFDLPRLPYVDEKFQPLTLNLNKHGSAYDYDWWWDIGEHQLRDDVSAGVIESAAESPNNQKKVQLGECSDAENCPVSGALSQGLPKLDADRWFDLYGVANTRMEYGHWYNLRNYDACVQDGVNSACVDLSMEALFGSPSIDWAAQARLGSVYDVGWSVFKFFKDYVSDLDYSSYTTPHPGIIIFDSLRSSEQMVFSEADTSSVDKYMGLDVLTPDKNAAHSLADYLKFDVPDKVRWLECRFMPPSDGWPGPMDNFHLLQTRANHYARELRLEPWQIMGSKIWGRATEAKSPSNEITYSDAYYYGMTIPVPVSDESWQYVIDEASGRYSGRYGASMQDLCEVYEHLNNVDSVRVSTYSHTVKPVIDKLGNYVAPGKGGVFANYPFSGNETNLRWLRSSVQDHATAITVASGQAGYVASAYDENEYLSFCLDNSDGETVCAEDWVRVKASPYITSIQLSPINAYAFIGSELQGAWWTSVPSGDPESGTQTWWVVGNDIDTNTTPHPTLPRTMVYSTADMTRANWVQFCVQPATDYVTGETVCSEKVFVDYDSDGDLIKDSVDLDDDNDNTADAWDRFPLDPSENKDSDGDGVGDNADTDDDNDGVLDADEVSSASSCPSETSTLTDQFNANSDGDDLLDGEDPYPCFAGEWLDVDGDGIHDKDDTDNDNDGVEDLSDAKRLEACVADNIVVTNGNDSGPGSLRQALSDLCSHKLGSPLTNGTISFDGPYTIRLQSPLQPHGGVIIDGNHEVTISGDSDGDGIADVPLFIYELPQYLPISQNLQLNNITVSHGKSESGLGSVVNLAGVRHVFFTNTLLSHNEAPAVSLYKGQIYIENSIVAHTSGSTAAIFNGGGYVGIFNSTLVNNAAGAIVGDNPEVSGQITNSLILKGESGSAECNIVNASNDGNWFEESSLCGEAGIGSVTLADATNGDYRPVPGSASIDGAIEQEGMTTDYAGNPRIQNLIPDIGALEYDPAGDFDGDGVADLSDNCLLSSNSAQVDTDSDGQGDACDDDDDNDNVPDLIDEFPLDSTESVDSDGDGLGDNADLDDDNDGVSDNSDAFPLDATESVDTDGDGIGNNADSDDDNDGVADTEDAFALDASESVDTDGDGIGNNADTDDDNDGVSDNSDAFPLDATESVDTDGDGVGNNADSDDDNDGVADTADAFALDASESVDTDGDGVGNNSDSDDDNDGVSDNSDAFPLDATESVDTDGDGVGNNADTDDDADGVGDTLDQFPLDGSEQYDTDGDGIGNNADSDDDGDGVLDVDDISPLGVGEGIDTDGDGAGDSVDSDDDNDGVADTADAFPLDAGESVDTDGDGIGNNADSDDDNDGVADTADAFALDATESVDTDGDGIGNNADSDDDNDGVADTEDAFPEDPRESRDSDGDGIGDNQDTVDDSTASTPTASGGGGAIDPLLLLLLGAGVGWIRRRVL